MLNITNEDCMELMARYPDKYFELSIVDPPYGLGWNAMHSNFDEGKLVKGWKRKFKKYKKVDWDNRPTIQYWSELFRVSRNQIIWGANNFSLPPTKSIIFWDKQTGDFSFGDGEIAWCSIGGSVKKFTFRWSGMRKGENGNYKENRIHPTQKPIPLYKWLLHNYAKPGDKILDTHLGSGSIAIACHDYGFDLTGCELDPEYFSAAMKRVEAHTAQQKLF